MKQLLLLIVVTALVMGILSECWLPEVRALFVASMEKLETVVYADTPSETIAFENEPGSKFARIDFIDTDENQLILSIKGELFVITRDQDAQKYFFYDAEGNSLQTEKIDGSNNKYMILDERYHDYLKLTIGKVVDEDGTITISMKRYDWKFHYDGETFWFHNGNGNEVVLHPVEHAGIIKDYSIGTDRGRIWDTTFSMLKHYIVTGSGADTFVFVFPQSDYVAQYNLFSHPKMNLITDKPHNLYLQHWVNTGLISLIAWLMLVGYYLNGAVKYFKRYSFETFIDFANGGIFCGILAFLAVALFNDGGVVVMPMFYTCLGVGLAINARDQWVKNRTVSKVSTRSK